MFDLIAGACERPLLERSVTSKVVTIVGHVVVVLAVIAIPLLQITNQLPQLPTMRAFVVEASAPPPPPPPPPPPAPAQHATAKDGSLTAAGLTVTFPDREALFPGQQATFVLGR